MTNDNGQTGTIELDRQESISIQNLSEALKEATSKGLKLILFNSCQGMGLARQITSSLANNRCPSIVVMRRNIMDKVAHTFLSRFSINFFEKRWPIDRSVTEATRYLANLESDAPGATSLPVLWSDSRLLPLNLPSQDPVKETQILKPRRHWLKIAIFFSIGLLLALGLWWGIMATTDICEFSRKQDWNSANLSCGERSLLSISSTDPIMKMKWKWFEDTEGMGIFARGNNYDASKALDKEWKQNIKPDSNNNPNKNYLVNPEIAIAKNNAIAMRDKASKPLRTIVALMPFPRSKDRESSAELHHISTVLLSGIAQAQEDWNENNNNKWQARVVMGIDENDPQYAKDRLIKKIFDRPQVLAAIGPYSSYIAMGDEKESGIVSEFDSHKLPLISATTTAPLPITAKYPYFFRTPSTNKVQAQKIIDFLKAKGIARVSLYHGEKIFSKTLKENLIDKGSGIKFVSHDTSSQTYSSEEIRNALSLDNSQAIVLCPDAFSDPDDRKNSQEMIRMLLGKKIEIPLIGNEAVNEPWLMKEIEGKSDGEIENLNKNLFFSLSWNNTVDKTNISQQLWDKTPVWWRDKYGQVYSRTALAYDATNIVLKAIDRSLENGMTDDRQIREKLPEAIREVTNDPQAEWLTGRITFNGSDRVQQLNGFVKPIFTKNPDGSLKVEFRDPFNAANPT
jgi:ABC-type branched-subunit amino acid transport system substrate-binding protein